MKVCVGCIIRNSQIEIETENEFVAKYKGKYIIISPYRRPYKHKYEHLKCFDIEVIDIKTGLKDVETYEYFHNIRDAVRYALKEACLI